MCVTAEGHVYYWGSRNYIEPHRMVAFDAILGSRKPVQVRCTFICICAWRCPLPPASHIVVVLSLFGQVAAGDNTCAVVDSAGALYTWGKGFWTGALGHGNSSQKQPKLVKAFATSPVAR